MSKAEIKLFVSYAHKDNENESVAAFIEDLQEHFKASRKFTYHIWMDDQILIGEDWHNSIQEALDRSDFGLLLLSLPFINSDYINEHELPDLFKSGKALPVGFVQFSLDYYDLKGLSSSQIFQYKNQFYDRCEGNDRKDFIEALFRQIEQRVEKNAQAKTIKNNKPASEVQADEYDVWLNYQLKLNTTDIAITDSANHTRRIPVDKALLRQPQQADMQTVATQLFGAEEQYRALLNTLQKTEQPERPHVRMMTDDPQFALMPWQDLPHPLTGEKIIESGGLVECSPMIDDYQAGYQHTSISSPLLIIPADMSHEIAGDSHFQLVHEYLNSYLGIIPGMVQRATTPESIKQELKIHEPDLIYIYARAQDNKLILDTDYMGESSLALEQLGEWLNASKLKPIVIINIRDSSINHYPQTLVANSKLVWLQQARKRVNIRRLDERLEKLFDAIKGDDDLSALISRHMLENPLDLPCHLWINGRSQILKRQTNQINPANQLRAALLRVMLGRAELKKSIGSDILNSDNLANRAMLSYVVTGTPPSCPFDVPAQIRHFLEYHDSERRLPVLPYWFHLTLYETHGDFEIYGAIDKNLSDNFLNGSGNINTVLRKTLKKRGVEQTDCCVMLNWMLTVPESLAGKIEQWITQWQEVLCDNFADEVPQRTVLVCALYIQITGQERAQQLQTNVNKALRSNQSCTIKRINNRRALGRLEVDEISDFFIEHQNWRDKLELENHDIDPDDYAEWIIEHTDGKFEDTVNKIWQEYRQQYSNYHDQ